MRSRFLRLAAASLLIGYVGSYVALSRLGASEARRHGDDGFFYVTPTDKSALQVHYFLLVFYTPLNLIDRVIGATELVPAKFVLFELGP